MNLPESELTQEEIMNAQSLFKRFQNPDLENILSVVGIVDDLAHSYYRSGSQYHCFRAFVDETGREGGPFFGLYVVAGYANKKGDRKDIDLLFATNMRWRNGFVDVSWAGPDDDRLDPFYHGLISCFGFDNVTIRRKLPDDYNLGLIKRKAIFHVAGNAKPMDIIYVRSWPLNPKFTFIDEQQFIEKDVDKQGQPLGRIPIYRSTNS